jgi:hypothetical protein
VGEPVGELSLTPTGCALLINEHVTGAVRLSLSNGRCKQGAVKMFSGVAAHCNTVRSQKLTSLNCLSLATALTKAAS